MPDLNIYTAIELGGRDLCRAHSKTLDGLHAGLGAITPNAVESIKMEPRGLTVELGKHTLHYRKDIQGMRAIAVLSVVIFHVWPKALPGGFVGVDIFFVLSGYLITSILIRDIASSLFSVAAFYRRRARRILPALIVLLVCCLAAGVLLLPPKDLKFLARNTLSTTLFLSNFDFWKTTGYFDGTAALKPLLHTWSLAVEEQFYIVYPLLLMCLMGRSRRTTLTVLAALFFASLACSIYLVEKNPTAAYFLPNSRAFELLAGGLVAYQASGRFGRVGSNINGIFALTLLLAPIFLFDEHTPFPGISALAPCLGVCLLLLDHSQSSLAARILSCRTFQFFGAISYSLYLWHWPVLSFARHIFGVDLDPLTAVVAAVLAVALAWASFRWVEQPFLSSHGIGLPYLRISAVAGTVIATLAVPLYATGGAPQRFSSATNELFSFADDFNQRRYLCHQGESLKLGYEDNCVYGGSAPKIVVWGDSHGAELVAAMSQLRTHADAGILQITYSACPPAIGLTSNSFSCENHNTNILKNLTNDSRIDVVVLAANAQTYPAQQELEQSFENVIGPLRQAGKSVIIVSQIPNFNFDPPEVAGRAAAWGIDLSTLGLPTKTYEMDNSAWRKSVTRLSIKFSARIVDPKDVLCTSKLCPIYRPGLGVLYFNKSHISNRGASLLAARVLSEIDLLSHRK